MDQGIRNKLRSVVTQCRKLLEEAVRQVLQGQFGIYESGKKDDVHVEDEGRMKNLSEEDKGYRRDIQAHLEHIQVLGYKAKDALAQLVREIAFTHLNRLCAYKMMEAREVWVGGQRFREAVSRGTKSQGFQFYLADHADDKKLFDTGHQDVAYRHFLGWLGALLSEEIGVLFSPTDPANRLFPPQRVLDDVLALLNSDDLKDIWTEDETIGWVYQYFTPKELRDQVRKESAAPRNSYELAFRNQFFTPRYVVEFLTDNTLGRIWYEMRKGDTKLKDQCRYMVRRPSEVFLADGQTLPEPTQKQDELTQEQLLKQPVHTPHRPQKDPRELRILDPACGSGHFLLYCFDLLLTIYEEAYADLDLSPKLKEDYPTLDALLRDVPRLILAHNLHGIDIDLRATQIAALALWLRCQRAYRDMGLRQERPKITRSNVVCAEPMPGEEALFHEFLNGLDATRVQQLLPRVIGTLAQERSFVSESLIDDLKAWVTCVWENMRLASNAGSLLQMLGVEPKLQQEVRQVFREVFESLFREELTSTLGSSEEEAVHSGVRLVLELLRVYVSEIASDNDLMQVLFREDTVRGMAFLDVCRREYDVVLMNPPFGESSRVAKPYIDKFYPRTKNDLYAAFVERGLNMLRSGGFVGAITSRSGFFLSSFQKWREEILLQEARPTVFADFGYGVLDTAMVETAAYCVVKGEETQATAFYRLLRAEDKEVALRSAVNDTNREIRTVDVFYVTPTSFRQVPGSPFAYWVSDRVRSLFCDLPSLEDCGLLARRTNGTTNDGRWIRLWWEPSPCRVGKELGWVPHAKGGDYSPFYADLHLVIAWDNKVQTYPGYEGTAHRPDLRPASLQHFFAKGITWSRRSQKGLSLRALPPEAIFGDKGPAIFNDACDLYAVLGIANSSAFHSIVRLQMAFGSYEAGVLQRTPFPHLTEGDKSALREHTSKCIQLKQALDAASEITHLFFLPALLHCAGELLENRACNWASDVNASHVEIAKAQARINDVAFRSYEIEDGDRRELESSLSSKGDNEPNGEEEVFDEQVDDSQLTDLRHLVTDLVSYCLGSSFGRWDIRFATGDLPKPSLPDPFSPIPACSPGMLKGDGGQPTSQGPTGYPLRIDGDGIIPDDPDHPDDIVRRVREVLELIWKDRAEAIEKEACEILGVKELRDYFRKPGKGGFWDDHVARYSKSRRKAPIYWLLQSSKKNYALWLYYHRLDKDILFKARQNYVEPKIRLEQTRLDSLRSQKTALGAAAKGARKIDKDIERQEALLGELKDFAEKLERAAKLNFGNPEKLNSDVVYDPDLNDGVVLNIAPLWELVPWKEAKSYWDELLEGKYEWSSMAKLLRKKGVVQC